MPTLKLEYPDGRKEEKELTAGTHRIGRSSHNEVVLDDPDVSRQHAEILVGELQTEIRDAGSTNGTYLRERRSKPRRGEDTGEWIKLQRLTEVRRPMFRAAIGPGDEIRIGGVRLRLVESAAEAARRGATVDAAEEPTAGLPLGLPVEAKTSEGHTPIPGQSPDLSSTQSLAPGNRPNILSAAVSRVILRRRRGVSLNDTDG